MQQGARKGQWAELMKHMAWGAAKQLCLVTVEQSDLQIEESALINKHLAQVRADHAGERHEQPAGDVTREAPTASRPFALMGASFPSPPSTGNVRALPAAT